jgi:cystathionine beta-lyase/cystathionine gamma-synthase
VSFRDREAGERVHKARRLLGGLLSPHSAFLAMRGIKTLPLRIERHSQSAARVAGFLAGHPAVARTWYPGLAGSAEHRVASTFLRAFGGVVSFRPAEGFDWERFTGRLRLCRPWMSFGDATTLVQYHHGRVRLSVGLEEVDDVVRDLDQALAHAVPSPARAPALALHP